MTMRLVTVLCITAAALSIAASTLHMINVEHFDWKIAARALGMCGLMLVVWSSARKKALRRASQGQEPARLQGPAAGP
jgi:hypothetical protein